MRKLSHEEIKSKRKDLAKINEYKRNPIYGLCDNIRSIFNVGAIFRASDGAFIEKVALGATLSVPWEYHKKPVDIIKSLKEKGIKICVVELTDESNILWNINENIFPVCLVVGNEITGVSKEIIELSDFAVEIPMLGMKQSLNVSVAYGIAVYEMLRKYKLNIPEEQ